MIKFQWKENRCFVNGKQIGDVYPRDKAHFWKWGYIGGYVTKTKEEAMHQVERKASDRETEAT